MLIMNIWILYVVLKSHSCTLCVMFSLCVFSLCTTTTTATATSCGMFHQQQQQQKNLNKAHKNNKKSKLSFLLSYFQLSILWLSQLFYCTVQLLTVIRISYNTQTNKHTHIFYMLLLFVHGTCCQIKQKKKKKPKNGKKEMKKNKQHFI